VGALTEATLTGVILTEGTLTEDVLAGGDDAATCTYTSAEPSFGALVWWRVEFERKVTVSGLMLHAMKTGGSHQGYYVYLRN
jgi:hypothetical protein